MIAALLSSALAAGPALELSGCEAVLDDTLARQLALEWPDAPEGTRVGVSCGTGPLRLKLELLGYGRREEEVNLPELTAEARGRLLALLVAERGRHPAGLPAVAARGPASGIAAAEPGREEPEASGLGVALWPGLESGPSLKWRASAGAVLAGTLWLGPLRVGPRVGLTRGPFTVALVATFGQAPVYEPEPAPKAALLGTIGAQAFTLEPELAVVGLKGRWLAAQLGVRGVLGYGVLSATTTALATGGTVQSVMAGGAATLALWLRLTSFLSVELDGALGAVWAPWARALGLPAAALGGGTVSGALSLVASWGAE